MNNIDKENLETMLRNVYELEGLIEHCLNAAEPDAMQAAVVAKIYELNAQAASWGIEARKAEPIEETTSYTLEEQESDSLPDPEEHGARLSPGGESPDPEEQVASKSPVGNEPAAKKSGKPVFSINDRFRFIRTLFAGKADDFNGALAEVAALDSYEEAENFFFDEFEWQPEDAEVESFLNVIKTYFES